jgi:hypothetical protein
MGSPLAVFPLRTSVKKFVASSTPISVPLNIFALAMVIWIASQAFCLGTNVSNFDGPAELPRVYVQSALADTPAPGHTIHVNVGGDLRGALDNASCGDTIELQAGASFAGTFSLPAKPCDDQHWIILRTSSPDSALPPEGIRMTPCYAGVAALPGRPDFHCVSTTNVMARLVLVQRGSSGPLHLEPGANHYRLMGLEITRLAGNGPAVDLILAKGNADHIILDRVWLHGTAQDETRRGILLSGITTAAIVDSYFSDFHCVALSGTCTDSQAIAGGSSTFAGGPYRIVDNFLEAAGECILFGGGASTTTATDMEISRNHLFKPRIWEPGQPGFVGGPTGNPFIVKNHFELKNAQRVLFEGNILENVWGGFTQHGFSVVLTPKGNTAPKGTVNRCPICQVTDITIRYNTISHGAGAFNIATVLTSSGVSALAGGRFSIHDVLIDDVSRQYIGSGTLFQIMSGWPKNALKDVSINHITGFAESHVLSLLDVAPNPKMSGLIFTNNIVGAGKYPVWSAGGGPSNCGYSDVPVISISKCFVPNTFTSNVIIDSPYPPSEWPAGNQFPRDVQAVDFLSFATHDYSLLPSSPYINEAIGDTSPGANIESIEAAISGVY